MKVTYEIEKPIVAIVHFKSEEVRQSMPGGRIVYYQVSIYPDAFTDNGFVRFESSQGSEIHGWQPADDIVIDEILGEVIDITDEGGRPAKGYKYTDYAKKNEQNVTAYFESLRAA